MNKKIIISLLSCLLLTSCNIDHFGNNESVKKLNKVEYPTNEKNYDVVNTYEIMPVIDFSYKTTSKVVDIKENNIYSPISLYVALSILAEGVSDEETTNQVNTLLGNDLETRREVVKKIFNNNYYENEEGKAHLANSFWSSFNESVGEEYLDVISKNYYAEIYNCNFANSKAKKTIIDWINNNTENLLKLTPQNYEIPDDLSSLILNTIYFENKWSEEHREYIKKQKFNLMDSTTVDASFIGCTYSGNYYDSTTFTAVTDNFTNGNSIDYFLPKDGYTVNDLLNDKALYTRENKEYCNIKLTTPKFKYDSAYDLNSTLMDLGVSNLFDSNAGHLNKINPRTYVSKVKQNAAIELDENGAKAAAVTAIENKCTSTGPQDIKNIEFTLDRPFVYVIYGAGKVPLFVGTVINPTK